GGVNYDAGGTTGRSGLEESFQALPQTGTEAAAVMGLFEGTFDRNAQSLSDAQATKAALFEHAPGKSFVHLATPGAALLSTADFADRTGV
ncbi:MAG: hypothetical protein ACI80N_003656, partial [Gammaproteobacteria bacterium]